MARKSAKKISPVVQEYNRQRQRIQKQIRRMNQRGYFGMEDVLPPRPKKITQASVRRLKKIKPKDLYDKADFVDLTSGEILGTGAEGRKIERRRAVEKAKQTRARRKHDEEMIQRGREQREKQYQEKEAQYEEEEFRREQAKRDRANRKRMEEEEEFRRQFEEGVMIAQQIEAIIKDIEDTFSRDLADYARSAWDKALRGDRRALYKRLSEHPEVIDALRDSYYQNRSGDHFRPTEFNKFVEIIQGSAMSAEEMQWAQDKYEQRQALDTDVDPDEEY